MALHTAPLTGGGTFWPAAYCRRPLHSQGHRPYSFLVQHASTSLPSNLLCGSAFAFFTRSQETNVRSPQPINPAEVERAWMEFPIETITPSEESFRHSGWRKQRRQVLSALQRTGQTANVIGGFVNCGSACRVLQSESTKEVRLAANYCKHRFCVPCGVSRSAKIARHVLAHMPDKGVRFLTLTLRHNHLPLRGQIDRCYASFRLLRHSRFWSAHVGGGISFLELKRSERDGLWHVHLHVLVIGEFMEQKALSGAWLAVTGDSSIVHIESVRDPRKVSSYIAKYSAKPLDVYTANHEDSLQEIVTSLKGRRMFTTFGCWRGVDFDDTTGILDDWKDIGSLDRIMHDARSGDSEAARILSQINYQVSATIQEHGPPELIASLPGRT